MRACEGVESSVDAFYEARSVAAESLPIIAGRTIQHCSAPSRRRRRSADAAAHSTKPSRTAPASPPRPSATRSCRSSPPSRAMCAGPSSIRVDKAHQVVREINHTAEREGQRPIIFITLVNNEMLAIVKDQSQGLVLDMFNTFIEPLEAEFGVKPTTAWAGSPTPGRARSTATGSKRSTSRLAHDDGQAAKSLERPTSSWWASAAAARRRPGCTLPWSMGSRQPTIRDPGGLRTRTLPQALMPSRRSASDSTIDPDRLRAHTQ